MVNALAQRKSNVMVAGEALVDVIVDSASGQGREVPGGSPANVAVALARLGSKPRLYTSFSDDSRGTMLQNWLTSAGVEAHVTTPPGGRTSTATATLNDDGAADYQFDLEWVLNRQAVAAASDWAEVLHTGSIATVLPPGADVVEACLRAAQGKALITFDPNARPAITPNRATTVATVERLVALADVVKVSAEDLAWYYPNVNSETAAASWLTNPGPQLVIITKGPAGAIALRQKTSKAISASQQRKTASQAIDTVRVPGEEVRVVDTIGAGDTFMGALIAALVEHGVSGPAARAQLAALDNENLSQILHWANAAAAIACTRTGANPPTRVEIENRYRA